MHRAVIALLLCLMSLACHPLFVRTPGVLVPPDQIIYDQVPGFGGQGIDVLEWQRKSASTPGEPPVTATLGTTGNGLRLRWLGTAGFEISDNETSILVDPFISRPPVDPLVSSQAQFRLSIDTKAVDKYVIEPMMQSGSFSNLKAILVSHTHHDHVEDVPYILSRFPKAANRPIAVEDKNLARVLAAYN